ncbi:MAG TPA: phospholipase D-like domain-containing protein [Tepidisphaeraceae bacterium]|nr:phospholipase D-like domain-containing protein [Tepidisphaeraceae bacterium]
MEQTTTVLPTGINERVSDGDDGWHAPDPVTLEDGSIVQLYKDGEALAAAFSAIENARHRICLEVYIFASDSTGRAFADLLSRKAAQGVQVLLIYDSFGSLTSDREMFRQMRAAGVKMRQFHPIRPWESHFSWRPCNRDHRKLLVIDDQIAGMGGLNVGREYAGSWVIRPRKGEQCDAWRDNAIGITGPAAHRYLRCFAKTWHYATRGGKIRNAEFDYNTESLRRPKAPGDDLCILASVPTMNSPVRPMLHSILRSATKSIRMTMAYFAPDDDLINELCRAARRGVNVQLMLPAVCDVKPLLIAARSFYEKLLTQGVIVYERQSVVLHAKTMTIDAHTTVIGSLNLDYRSIEYNLELSSVIRSDIFGQQMHDLFDNDVRYARRINLKEWRRRPTRDRLVQWAVSRARYLL